jgi:hypothetical protein
MYKAKESHVLGKRDLCIRQRRPMYKAKKECAQGKRDLCRQTSVKEADV